MQKQEVTLKAGKVSRSFVIEHAENILKMPKNGGWKLPKDSNYKFDSKHGLIKRADK